MARRDSEFTEYVSAQRTRLRRTAYLLCGDWTHAEDIVQIALVKLYLAWPRVRGGDRVDAYVRRIVSRTAVDEWRRPVRREVVHGDDLVDLMGPADAGMGYEERSALVTALLQLPPRQRQIVVLRHWWGGSVAEVAKDLKISPGTVKSQTARALERLNTILSEQLEPVAGSARPKPEERHDEF